MLIVIDRSPCSLSLRNRSMFNYEMPSKQIGLKKCFCTKIFFFSLSSVISIPIMLIGINGGYFPAICRVCLCNLHRLPVQNTTLRMLCFSTDGAIAIERLFESVTMYYVIMERDLTSQYY